MREEHYATAVKPASFNFDTNSSTLSTCDRKSVDWTTIKVSGAYLHAARTLGWLRDLQCLKNGRKVDTKVGRRELLDRLLLSLHDGRQGRVTGLYGMVSMPRESSGIQAYHSTYKHVQREVVRQREVRRTSSP